MRTIVPVLPAETGSVNGLAFTLWLPGEDRPAQGGVVILHGAGSCKENHHDFARALLPPGFAAVAYDQRGHGESAGPMDARALYDVAAMTRLLRERVGTPHLPVALRGSSMGGYLAIVAAPLADARAVIAICPASAEGLRRGLASGRLGFAADVPGLDRLLSDHDEFAAVEALRVPLLLLHAEGDEQVPVQHSRELAARISAPGSRLITLPGGHHRSIQHDPEIRAVALRWLGKALGGRA
jgi:alpha-beta hydrolase superfamily lysophospholipase